jgi:hypothetical protein
MGLEWSRKETCLRMVMAIVGRNFMAIDGKVYGIE